MKTTILTLIAAVTLTATTATFANAKTTDSNATVVLTDVTHINKIEARGNVEVYITNGAKDEVKVFDNYYAQNALVQGNEGTLRISSYAKDKLVVLVTVTDLRAVAAYDNAAIKTKGTLSTLALDVKLNNTASAQLKLDAITTNVIANDRATADLSGNVDDYSLTYAQSSTVNRTTLTAQNRNERVIAQPVQLAKTQSSIEDVVASL